MLTVGLQYQKKVNNKVVGWKSPTFIKVQTYGQALSHEPTKEKERENEVRFWIIDERN